MNVAVAAFAASLIAYFGCGVAGHRRVTSVETFFHVAGVRRGLVALVVANITLGTGLAYLFTAGAKNGFLALAIPLGAFTGYVLLGRFLKALPDRLTSSGGNLLIALRNEIESARSGRQKSQRSVFDFVIVLPLIAIFLMLFTYEIFVSAQIIGPFVNSNSQVVRPYTLAGVMFITALVYCLMGGMQAVYRAGILQLIGVVSFIGLLVYAGTVIFSGTNSISYKPGPIVQFGPQTAVNCALGFIDAIATQFYSLINVYAATHLNSAKSQSRLMRWNGVILACLLAPIIVIGATAPSALANIATFMGELAKNLGGMGLTGSIAIAALMFGMTAVVMSTVDNLIVALTYFVRKNVMRASTFEQTAEGLFEIRLLMVLLFFVCFLALGFLFTLQPDVFYLLLAIASGAVVFTPLVIALGLMSRLEGALAVVSNGWLSVFGALFVLAWSAGFSLVKFAPRFVPYLSLTLLIISSFAALCLYYNGRRVALQTERMLEPRVAEGASGNVLDVR